MGGTQEPDTLGPHPVLCTPPLRDGSVLRGARAEGTESQSCAHACHHAVSEGQRALASEISKLKGAGGREPLANEDAALTEDSGDHGSRGHRYNREEISRCWKERMAFS